MSDRTAWLRERLRLYLVVDPDFVSGDLDATIRKAIGAGVTMIQLRAKLRTDRETLAIARPLRILCQDASIPFIMNDRLDLALAVDADGVHLGVDDLPLEIARRLGGPEFIIGYSPETDAQLTMASMWGASYLGIGPVFTTATKADAGSQLGLAEFARRRSLTDLPVVGIGGISATNARSAVAAGADGIAVVSAILRANDPATATSELIAAITR